MHEEHQHSENCGEHCNHDHEPKGPEPINLNLPKTKKPLTERGVEKYVKAALGITVAQVKKHLRDYVSANAEKLCEDIVSLAPYDDYSKLLDETPDIVKFFKGEMNKAKNWKLKSLESKVQEDTPFVAFSFVNKAADDGSIVKGFVFIDHEGQPMHVIADGSSKFFDEVSSAPKAALPKEVRNDRKTEGKNGKK